MQKLKDYFNESLYDYTNSLSKFKSEAVGEAKNMAKNFKGSIFNDVLKPLSPCHEFLF
jgi:hypothetical protein